MGIDNIKPMIQNNLSIESLIDYLEQIPDDLWLVDRVRKDGRNCVTGHIFNYGGGDDNKDEYGTNGGTLARDWFENTWATTYMIYVINDGETPTWMNENYDQPTPKARVLAYIKNLRDGKEKNTRQLMEEDAKRVTPNQ